MVLNDVIAQKGIQLISKDTIIATLKSKLVNFESIINNKDRQQSLNSQLNEDLQKALEASKRRTFFYKVGTGVGAIVTLILIAK